MKRVAVKSTNITSVGYDKKTKTLEVELNERVYQYFDVPEKIYKEFLKSPSLGKYFAASIKNSYKFERK